MIHAMLFMNAITPVHNGAGEGLGLIDRPILRERITNFPVIQGSSLKGVLKDAYRPPKLNDDELDIIFGPDDGEKHASAMAFGDGNILCFPIRSLNGGFVWAASPLVLRRFLRVIEMANLESQFVELIKLVKTINSKVSNVIINPQSEKELLIGKKNEQRIILEEFPLQVDISNPDIGKCAEEISNAVYKNILNEFLRKEFISRFVILPEKSFSYFVKYATEVVPNIKIDDKTGTSREGLRYTEYLPSETIVYSLIGFEKPRIANSNGTGLKDAIAVKKKFDIPPERIQIGADETKGKGFVELSILHNVGVGNG